MNDFNPLQLKCTSCGAAVEDFDIVKQEYRCSACGCGISARSVRENYEHWMHEHAQETVKTVGQHTENGLLCPSCGADVSFKTDTKGELIQTTCEYCGTHFVASPPGKKFVSPDMIIPFFITLNEAKERLKDWCQQNKFSKEAKLIREKLDELKGYYLPYEVVKGPIRFTVTRDKADGVFICGGYLGGTAVSTNSDQHNLTLDGMEPFDWNGARAYDIGYIVGQSVKLQDMYDKNKLNRRVFEEVEHAYLPVMEKELQTTGISAKVVKSNPEWIRGTALLPAYVLNVTLDKGRTLHIAVNGQTGRVAVERIKPRTTGRFSSRYILPSLVVLLAAWGILYPTVFAYDYDFMPGGLILLFLCSPFFIFLWRGIYISMNRIWRRERLVIMQGDEVKASRSGSLLEIVKEKLPSVTALPVFFEYINNEETPVKITIADLRKYLTAFLYVLLGVVMVFLPWIIASLIALIAAIPLDSLFYDNGETFLFMLGTAFILLLLSGSQYKRFFENPMISYKAKDGSKVRVSYKKLNKYSKEKYFLKRYGAVLIFGICCYVGFGASATYEVFSEKPKMTAYAQEKYKKGLQYQNGEGVEQNYEEAFKYFKLAADQEYAPAQYEIGICYEYGNGVEADITEAIKWYRLAAEQGNADAYNQLGIVYFDGNGVELDYNEAFKYFKLAADKGDMYAQYNVGECYEFGDGVEEDITEAIKWYKLAAAQGHPEAQEKLEDLEEK